MSFIIEGGVSTDERGIVRYVNDFKFEEVKRFYIIQNSRKGFIRDWHGHLKETIYAYVTSGRIVMGLVNIENFEAHKFELEGIEPKILRIPPGYASSFKSLTDDAQVIFFSTATLEESISDSIRWPKNRWDILDPEAE